MYQNSRNYGDIVESGSCRISIIKSWTVWVGMQLHASVVSCSSLRLSGLDLWVQGLGWRCWNVIYEAFKMFQLGGV